MTGIAIGVLGALLLGRLLRTFLFEVSAADPLTLVSISAGLLASVLLASSIPARRAARIDPVIALKS